MIACGAGGHHALIMVGAGGISAVERFGPRFDSRTLAAAIGGIAVVYAIAAA